MKINANEVFGWSAAFLSIITYIFPISTYLKVCKGQVRFNDAPNLRVLLNYFICINWIIYGYLLKDIHILFCNLAGALFSFFCVATFLIILGKLKKLKAFFFTIMLFVYTLLSYLLFVLLIKNIDVIGYICVAISFISLIDSFSILKMAIKFRNYKFIHIKLYLINLIATTCWIIYGFMIINFHVIIPNFIGLVSSFILMFIWNLFRKRKSNVEDINNMSINASKVSTGNTVTIT